jgi:predicted metal-dependent peptidase
VLEPTVDWREVLAGSVRRAVGSASGAVDYTYQRPSRRAASQPGVVLPSLRRPIPTIAIVIDTSGSMGDQELAAALSEVAGVLRGVGIRGNRVTVLSCDAAVHVAQRVTRAEQIELHGGGGTDMRVGIATALDLPQRPDVIVVLTDGFTPWPDEPSGPRVIAGLIGPSAPLPPDWIESVHIG